MESVPPAGFSSRWWCRLPYETGTGSHLRNCILLLGHGAWGERQHRMIGPSETGGLVAVPHQAAERAGAASRLVVPRATGPIAPDRYACHWSHADWTPGHIHFVLQPAWNALRSRYPGPGPALQMAMFTEAQALDPHAVRVFCARARSAFASEPSRS